MKTTGSLGVEAHMSLIDRGLKVTFPLTRHRFTRQQTQAPRLQLETQAGLSRGAAPKPSMRTDVCCPWCCWKDTHTKVLTGEGKDEIRSTEYPMKSTIETFFPWVFYSCRSHNTAWNRSKNYSSSCAVIYTNLTPFNVGKLWTVTFMPLY